MVDQVDNPNTEFGFAGTAQQDADNESWQATRGNYQYNFRGDIRQSARGDTKYNLQTVTFTGTLPAAGNEAKLAALREEFILDWSNDSDYDTGTGTNHVTTADTVIIHNGEVVLVIEDYTDELHYTQFDIY